MHFMQFLNRSALISRWYSSLPLKSTKFNSFNYITVVIIALFISSVHGRVINIRPPFEHPRELFIVEEFKRRILDHMGLKAPPKIDDKFLNKTHVREIYKHDIASFMESWEKRNHLDGHLPQEEIVPRSVTKVYRFGVNNKRSQIKLPIPQDSTPVSTHATFQFSPITSLGSNKSSKNVQLKSAALLLRFKGHNSNFKSFSSDFISQYNIKIYHMNPDFHKLSSNDISSRFTLISSFIVDLKKSPFVIRLKNITNLLLSQRTHEHKQIRFIISASKVSSHQRSTTKISIAERRNHKNISSITSLYSNSKIYSNRHIILKPNLVLKIKETSEVKRRYRRSAGESCNRNSPCCRHKVSISFADIEWDDWVVAPDRFDAYYCQGGCPKYYKSASYFSGIKASLHEENPFAIPAPVCAAGGYKDLQLFHFVKNETTNKQYLKKTYYPDMIVTNCKCY